MYSWLLVVYPGCFTGRATRKTVESVGREGYRDWKEASPRAGVLKIEGWSGSTNRKISYRPNMPVNHRRVNVAHTFSSDSCPLPLLRQLLSQQGLPPPPPFVPSSLHAPFEPINFADSVPSLHLSVFLSLPLSFSFSLSLSLSLSNEQDGYKYTPRSKTDMIRRAPYPVGRGGLRMHSRRATR